MIEDVVEERCERFGREGREKVVSFLSLQDLCKLRNFFALLFLFSSFNFFFLPLALPALCLGLGNNSRILPPSPVEELDLCLCDWGLLLVWKIKEGNFSLKTTLFTGPIDLDVE